jgi:hypothetical protein
MCCHIRVLLCLIALISPATVLAGPPVDRAFTALGSGSFGQPTSVGPTGNLGVALPLRLPSPRGDLPLPLTVAHNGSNSVGVGGVGWDIPILGVTFQRNVSRRKPLHRFTSQAAEPRPADRIFLDIGGGPMLMASTNTPGVYQPFGNGYYELRFANDAFTGRDGNGRLYVFQRLPALFNDDFFALVRIQDASGINRVDLQYDVFDRFSPEPVVPPFTNAQLSARELVLRELAYSHDASGTCPKYRVQLTYSAAPSQLGFEIVGGRPRSRTRLLENITLLTCASTTCEASALRTESVYQIKYTPDQLTGQPRLTTVDMFGLQYGAPTPNSLPVVAYRYGHPLVAGQLQYIPTEHITLPAGPSGANTGISASLGTSAIYGLVRYFLDFNGDGCVPPFTRPSVTLVSICH